MGGLGSGMGSIYTADVAEALTRRGQDLLATVAAVVSQSGSGLSVSGYGSMLNIHASAAAPRDGRSAMQREWKRQELLYLGMLERGVYLAPRGMVNLSLAVTDAQIEEVLGALDEVCRDLASHDSP